VYCTGLIGRESSSAYLTVAYNAATGARVWRTVYAGEAGSDAADAIAASPDGSTVYVTGETQPFVAGQTTVRSSNYATVAYNASTGARLWTAIHQGAMGQHLVVARSVTVSPDSSTVFVTGYANGSILTLAYQG
jgi:outer membrane protein assembly factor BamB